MKKLIDLTDRKILVIGASSGIGRQTAITLSGSGAAVIAAARREEQLKETISALEPGDHRMYTVDVSHPEEIEDLFKKIKEEVGPLDGLVYSAGVRATYPLMQLKPEKLSESFQINYFGFVECVRQMTRRGRYNAGARVVAVSSIAAECGDKAHTAYASAKAAINAAVRCLAAELADKGICVNAVAPAMTRTEMYTGFSSEGGSLSDQENPLLRRQYLGIGEPEDTAAAIAFLISPAARFITGTILPVDGGYTST